MYDSIVNLTNLPDTFYLDLETSFRRSLFTSAGDGRDLPALASKVGYSPNRLRCLQAGKRTINGRIERNLISKKLLLKLLQLGRFSEADAEAAIIGARGHFKGLIAPLKLPIKASPELASLVGHALGDGHVGLKGFIYSNKERALLDSVQKSVGVVFGHLKPYSFEQQSVVSLRYPRAVGRILVAAGAIEGNKAYQNFGLPEWITNGSFPIRTAFIRALFDDEGSVDETNIILGMACRGEPKQYMIALCGMLNDLGIRCTVKLFEPCPSGRMHGLRIKRYENLSSFAELVGFTHPQKAAKLQVLLAQMKTRHYLYVDTSNLILKRLQKDGPQTTKKLATALNRDKETIRVNLNSLLADGKVQRRVAARRTSIWQMR